MTSQLVIFIAFFSSPPPLTPNLKKNPVNQLIKISGLTATPEPLCCVLKYCKTLIWRVFLFGAVGGEIKIRKNWDSSIQFRIQLHNKQ